MDKDKIALKTVQGLTEAAAYLEDFARGLRAGRILIEQGEGQLALCPPDMVEVEVQAKSKKDKQKFVLAVSWHSPGEYEAIVISPAGKTTTAKIEPTVPADGESTLTSAELGVVIASALAVPAPVEQTKMRDKQLPPKIATKAAKKAGKGSDKATAKKGSKKRP